MTQDDVKYFLTMIFLVFVGYTMYNWGYHDGKYENNKPTKYKCYEGTLYRDDGGYWSDLKQACKTYEQIQ